LEGVEMEKTKILKCVRCKKSLEVPESYQKLCCPTCLEQRKIAYRQNKPFTPTKEDYEQKAKIEAERTINPFGVDGYLSIFRPSPRESREYGLAYCSRCGGILNASGKCDRCQGC